MILELHNKSKKNSGDFFCNPSRYFNFPNVQSKRLNARHTVKNKTLVLGGGGLIHKHWVNSIESLLDQQPKQTVLWGIGHNSKGFNENYIYYPKWLDRCQLIGIRDWIEGYQHYYLPDVTCMHSAFDKSYEEKHDVVFYIRARKHELLKQDTRANSPIVLKNSERDFFKIIEFLGSAKTIVTDSYHGTYWGQLLGKNVKTYAWGVKFLNMRHKVNFIDDLDNWKNSKSHIADSDFLEESRNFNNNFYTKFLNLLD